MVLGRNQGQTCVPAICGHLVEFCVRRRETGVEVAGGLCHVIAFGDLRG